MRLVFRRFAPYGGRPMYKELTIRHCFRDAIESLHTGSMRKKQRPRAAYTCTVVLATYNGVAIYRLCCAPEAICAWQQFVWKLVFHECNILLC